MGQTRKQQFNILCIVIGLGLGGLALSHHLYHKARFAEQTIDVTVLRGVGFETEATRAKEKAIRNRKIGALFIAAASLVALGYGAKLGLSYRKG